MATSNCNHNGATMLALHGNQRCMEGTPNTCRYKGAKYATERNRLNGCSLVRQPHCQCKGQHSYPVISQAMPQVASASPSSQQSSAAKASIASIDTPSSMREFDTDITIPATPRAGITKKTRTAMKNLIFPWSGKCIPSRIADASRLRARKIISACIRDHEREEITQFTYSLSGSLRKR